MNPWQVTFFGLKQIPRELTACEIEAFFTFTATKREVIEQRRRAALKLGLALQIGFLRMSGRVLDAVRIVPAVLWRHLGEQFGAPPGRRSVAPRDHGCQSGADSLGGLIPGTTGVGRGAG